MLGYYLSRGASILLHSPPAKQLIANTTVTRATISGSADCLWYFESSDRLEFSLPKSIDEAPSRFRELVGMHKISRPFVAEFSDVELVGPNALTITDDGILFENVLGNPVLLAQSIFDTLRTGSDPFRKRGASESISTAVSLVGPWSSGYYHWFMDYLTRVQGLQRYAREFSVDPLIIIPPDPPTWMQDSLRRVGIPSDRWRKWSGGRLSVDRLIVPSLRFETALTGNHRIVAPRAYRWLANRIKSDVGVSEGQKRRIFISREKAARRRVSNQGAILSALKNRGFQKYVLEDLTFDDQVELFANADCIVAPTGAGLVNMMYSTDATVVTLFGRDLTPCYLRMAAGLGFDSGYVIGEPKQLDMRIPPWKLTQLLDSLGVG